jgi:probable rRNA maturation factor
MTAVCLDTERESALWDSLPDAEAIAERALNVASELADVKLMDGAELALLLSDDAHVKSVNQEWRNIDKPTNVLSFPSVEANKLARAPFIGDIIIAYETVKREAEHDGKDFADHFTHLVVHGFLHLVGFDHQTDAEAKIMEALETRILAELEIPDPYADEDFALLDADEQY